MPKKLGQARNPPLHYSSNQFLKAADSQVTRRNIRDCDLEEVERLFYFIFVFVMYSLSSQKSSHKFPLVHHNISSASVKLVADK